MIPITLVICTHNRAKLLDAALESVSRQTVDRSSYEVIVVDNKSTDSTKDVCLTYCGRHPHMRYLHEPEQGLSCARNLGYGEASGEYVAYLDDDCTLPAEWVEVALEIIDDHRPHIFGGPFYPFYQDPKPYWFLDRYGAMVYGDEARQLDDHEWLSGNNIVFRRQLLEDLGGFDKHLGMSGNQLGFGEETAMIIAAREKVPNLNYYYDPRLYILHYVAPYKMQLVAMAKKSFYDGRYHARVFDPDSKPRIWNPIVGGIKILFWVGAFLVDLGIAVSVRSRSAYPYVQNYLYEHSFRILRQVGKAYEAMR